MTCGGMAVREIEAKTILAGVHHPDHLFGLRYNMNLYRGCQHQCIYCDSRSQCYEIENFNSDVLVKTNALELLEQELPRKRVKGKVGTGSMNDPYMPLEMRYDLTGRALEILQKHGFGVQVITKSALVLRDIARLAAFGPRRASVCFSITTTDDALGKIAEPGASLVSERLAAMQTLAQHGIPVGVCMMPILPFLEDSEENVGAIVTAAAQHGARFALSWFGMSLRDRQRDYYYAQLDRHFPGLRARYESAFGSRYGCPARNASRLERCFASLCQQYGLRRYAPPYGEDEVARQPRLF